VGETLMNIGVVYSNLGQYKKALEYYKKAVVILEKIGGYGSLKLTRLREKWQCKIDPPDSGLW